MLVIAHRGANKEAVENSREAFEKAIEAGADRIECDVQLSRDGEPVVIHDPTLDRTTDSKGQVADLDLSQLADVKMLNQEPIPSLREILELFAKKISLNLEMKGNSRLLADKVGKLVKDTGCANQTIISCFHWQPLEHLKNHFPELQRACLIGTVTLASDRPSHFAPQIFMKSAEASIIHPEDDLVNENFMEQAKRYNWQVFPWTPLKGREDNLKELMWQRLLNLGVDGFCTNYPREFSHFLKVLE